MILAYLVSGLNYGLARLSIPVAREVVWCARGVYWFSLWYAAG
jgi:hypothetical protein